MGKYLITGMGGSGKSAVCDELQSRGFNSLDGDAVEGLARAEDLSTGIQVEVDWSQYVDWNKIGWNWQDRVLKELLAANTYLYLCGSASNQLEFHRLFDGVFVLTVDPDEQYRRLSSRIDTYGSDERQRREILDEQAWFVDAATKLGATAIDSNRPVAEVVNHILELTREKPSS